MLRAQTLVTLKEYHAALFDVSRLIDLNPESDVYQNLQARLKTQMVCSFPSDIMFLCLFSMFTDILVLFIVLSFLVNVE